MGVASATVRPGRGGWRRRGGRGGATVRAVRAHVVAEVTVDRGRPARGARARGRVGRDNVVIAHLQPLVGVLLKVARMLGRVLGVWRRWVLRIRVVPDRVMRVRVRVREGRNVRHRLLPVAVVAGHVDPAARCLTVRHRRRRRAVRRRGVINSDVYSVQQQMALLAHICMTWLTRSLACLSWGKAWFLLLTAWRLWLQPCCMYFSLSYRGFLARLLYSPTSDWKVVGRLGNEHERKGTSSSL